MFWIFIFLGLALGSFITAFVWRLHDDKDFVRGRSQCDACENKLQPIDLIPLFSWLLLRGKCRHCGKPISWQYPIIELLTAGVFASSFYFWPSVLSGLEWVVFGLWLISMVFFVSLAVYDTKWMLLPDKIMWPLVMVSAIAAIFQILSGGGVAIFRDKIWGIIVAFGFFYLLSAISKGKWIGGGDVKFGLVMGLWLGALNSLVALLLGFYSAALFILPLMVINKIGRKSQIPFGPFLIASTFIAQLFGSEIVDWYSNIILGGGL